MSRRRRELHWLKTNAEKMQKYYERRWGKWEVPGFGKDDIDNENYCLQKLPPDAPQEQIDNLCKCINRINVMIAWYAYHSVKEEYKKK